MKRLTEEEKIRFQKIAKRRAEHSLIRDAKAKHDAERIARLTQVRKERYLAFSRPIYSLTVPSELSLTTNYDAVVRIAQDLKFISLARRMPVGIDFSKVKSLGPAGALYLAAEIHRWSRR